MKKLIWFTKDQIEQFEILKKLTGMNNSELVREALDRMYKSIMDTANKGEK